MTLDPEPSTVDRLNPKHPSECRSSLEVSRRCLVGAMQDTIIMVGPATGEEVHKRAKREGRDKSELGGSFCVEAE